MTESMRRPDSGASANEVLCVTTGVAVWSVGWYFAAMQFRRSCRARAGWVGLFVRYQLVGGLRLAALLAIPLLILDVVHQSGPGEPMIAGSITVFAGFIVLLIARWAYGPVRADMHA